MPWPRLLERPRELQEPIVAVVWAYDLQAHRQARPGQPRANRDGGVPREVERNGERSRARRWLHAPFGEVFLDITLMIAASRTHLVRSSQCFQRVDVVQPTWLPPCIVAVSYAAAAKMFLTYS